MGQSNLNARENCAEAKTRGYRRHDGMAAPVYDWSASGCAPRAPLTLGDV
jgi:hypothetical protein